MESVGLIELSSCLCVAGVAEKVPSLAVVLCLDLATRMPESHTNQITQNYYKFEFTQSQSHFFPIVPPHPCFTPSNHSRLASQTTGKKASAYHSSSILC